MCLHVCLCESTYASVNGSESACTVVAVYAWVCLCFYVLLIVSLCVSALSVSGRVCACLCVCWKSQQGTQCLQSEDK